MEDEFVFYFYDSLNKLQQEPHMRKVEYEEDILLSAEVYAREAFSNQIIRFKFIAYFNHFVIFFASNITSVSQKQIL